MSLPLFDIDSISPSEDARARREGLLRRSLARREVNPRLHYETDGQARRWLKVHRRYSPAANSARGFRPYRQAFRQVARAWEASAAQVVSLGCGGGKKDQGLLRFLAVRGVSADYVPVDVSPALVRAAAVACRHFARRGECRPIVADLAAWRKLAPLLEKVRCPTAPRLVLFFGMLPNLDPQFAQRALRGLLRRGDVLLLSANLLPERDPRAARRILAQYDNPETRDWLMTLVRDLGLPTEARCLRFALRPCPGWPGARRIEAVYRFPRAVEFHAAGRRWRFRKGERWLLFFSNRPTLRQLEGFLAGIGLRDVRCWTEARGEEAVASCFFT